MSVEKAGFDFKGELYEKPMAVFKSIPDDIPRLATAAILFAALHVAKGYLLRDEPKAIVPALKKGAVESLGLYIGIKLLT